MRNEKRDVSVHTVRTVKGVTAASWVVTVTVEIDIEILVLAAAALFPSPTLLLASPSVFPF